MSRAFVDAEMAAGTSEGRAALLEYLLRTETVARSRRDDAAFALIPPALMAYDGDRTALRRNMLDGDLTDMIPLLGLDTPDRGGRAYQVVLLLWLNGCLDEAFDTLARDPWPPRALSILPLATGETELARRLVAATRDDEPNQFQVTLLDLADRPEDALRILNDFKALLDEAVVDFAPEDQLNRFAVETALAVLVGRDLPPAPSKHLEHNYAALAAVFAANDGCAAVAKVIAELEQVPPSRDDFWRPQLDVAAVRCALR